jgi:hypothetical protein
MLLFENLCLQTTADLRQLAENCLRGQEYFQEQGPEAIAKNVRNGTAFYTLLILYSSEKSQNRVANERLYINITFIFMLLGRSSNVPKSMRLSNFFETIFD